MRKIDADALLEKFETLRNRCVTQSIMHRVIRGTYVECMICTKNAPTVDDAQPVTTVWIRGKNKDDQDGIYCCECEYFVPLLYDYYYDVNDLKKDYMYCPHCGRKVEGS